MSEARPTVLLLRSGDNPESYEEALATEFVVKSVTVLEFERINSQELRHALARPRKYDGLILTSPRAAEALADVMPWLPSENSTWHGKSVFAVGPRTAAGLRAIGFEPEGEDSGSAEMLASYIARQEFEKPLLFLCGDRRRDVLPGRLREAGIPFEELRVYRTIPQTDLDFTGEQTPDWIVLFSPSGIEAVDHVTGLEIDKVRIAAIGRTTAAAAERHGWKVDAIAEEPSPDGIAAAIRAASI